MPNFPEERRQLVTAVADGLPHKLLFTQTRQQRKVLAIEFGQAHSIPTHQALQAADTWFYALQDAAKARQGSLWFSWAAWRNYLGGVLTGVIILLVGSSIAFYKKPETIISARQSLNTTLTTPLIEIAGPIKPTTTAPLRIRSPVTSASLSSTQLAELTTLLPSKVFKSENLANLDTEIANPQLALITVQAATEFESLSPVKLPELQMNTEPTRKTPMAIRPAASKVIPSKTQPSFDKSTQQPTSKVQTQGDEQSKVPLKSKHIASQQAFAQTLQAMQTLSSQVVRLRKKQADQQAVTQLLTLTGDGFYRQQLESLDEQVKDLNSTIDQLSVSYSSQVAKLCGLAATGWQNEAFIHGKPSTTKLQQTVLEHWKHCKGLSHQQIKQQLLANY
ncbi:MAG TPA: hypothetical protein PLM98_17885, partial [Thiolinea sp.]|nr:hypothetical protein [Thiolinea sp.]